MSGVCAWLGAATPSTLRSAVVNGIITRSSWSWPNGVWPLAASTPITRSGTPLTRIVRADRVLRRRRTAGLDGLADDDDQRGAASSSSVEIARPAAMRQLVIGG